MLISSFLQPSTGGQGSLRQAIMYDYNNKSNEKQRLKSKTDPTWSQNWLFPVTEARTKSVLKG